MSEWQTYKLREVGTLQRGRSRHRPRYAFHLFNGPYPFIQTGEVREARKYISTFENTYSEAGLAQSKLWPKGTLCITIAANIAELGILGFDACFPDSVLGFIPDTSKSDLDFVYYTLTHFQKQLKHIGEGSVQDNINLGTFEDIEFPFPSLPEQKAIASVLSSLDDKIDLLHRQNKTLEAMAETLFRQWFIEEAKEDWEEVPLSDYLKVKHGYAFKGEFITPAPTKYRLVTPGNFEIGGGFKFAKFKYYSSDVIPEDYIFNELDFVVTMTDLSKEGDTLGYPAFVPLHHKAEVLYLHNQRVGKVQFHSDEKCKFFFYMLMKQGVYQQFIVGSCTGTSVKHTSPTTIGSFTFAKPPKERMQEFDRIVGQNFAKIFANTKQIQTLENLRDTLLPKLMSGEVRVQYQTQEVA